ncbi:MAG: wax ester/triacylglycerol synthase family O-acyltransferase [Pseudomonadota bacterium]
MRQLSGQDASFLYMDAPNCEMHGTLVFIYDPSDAPQQPVRFKDILRHVESRLSVSSIFRQRLVQVPFALDHPYWINDANFDIEYHVRHVALPKPSDWRQFYILLSRLNAPPLNPDRPLWEMVVIEGLDRMPGVAKGSFALLIKGHHCAMDGHSAAELTMGLHDMAPDGARQVAVPAAPLEAESPPGLLTMLARALGHNLSAPARMLAPARRALPGMAAMMTRFYRRASGERQLTRFNRQCSPHRVFAMQTHALADIKRIRASVPGATVNDTVLSIAAGAVRAYLQDKGELPETTLRVLAPINTRQENEFGQAGNRISMFFPDVHTNIGDPLERLAAVYESTRHAKEVADGIGARDMTDLNRHSPAALTMLASKLFTHTGLTEQRTPFFHFGLSNAPGPSVPLFLCGAKLQAWTVLVPLSHGFGLGFAVTSYMDKLTMSFTADRKAMPDPDFMEQCVARSFSEHLAAALARPLPRTKAKAKAEAEAEAAPRRKHPGMDAMKRMATPVEEAAAPARPAAPRKPRASRAKPKPAVNGASPKAARPRKQASA